MSKRNEEHQFVSTNSEEIVSVLVSAYEELTKTIVRPASPERLFIEWAAQVIIQERVLTNWSANQNLPSRAEGENLDALAELTYIQKRPSATAAACTIRFHLSQPREQATLIPSGTRVTDADSTLFWATDEDHYIPAGNQYVDVGVRCQTLGAVGNGYAPGQISTLVDIYDYYSQCSNITASDGGSDVPTDEEYFQLMRASMDAYSCAGAKGSYIYWAKQVSTAIADVVANSPTPGIVKLYVLMENGAIASEEIKSQVLAACNADEVRPLTDWVFVEDAEAVIYDIQFTYYVHQNSTQSGAQIAAAVQTAVDRYIAWQSGKLGRDINPSKLISLLMQTGIKRVDLVSPVFTPLRDGNLALNADMSYDETLAVPQLAQVGSTKIMNGGYEDE